MDAGAIRRAIKRLAHQIIEDHPSLEHLALVGIPNRGVELSRRLQQEIEAEEGVRVHLGVIDVSMHRDDITLRRQLSTIQASSLPFELEDCEIILVDDVFFTGRTCRAALDAITSFGRPPRIRFAALIDRGYPELPIAPQYTGKKLHTTKNDHVEVRFENVDNEPDAAWLKKL